VSIVDFMLSQRQQHMLAAMVNHPEREFGTNELISIGGPGVGAGRNVIREFVRCGVVVQRRRGNQVVYSVNRANPIYHEMSSICRKTFGLADVFTQALQPFNDRIALAFIFGSIARGSERPDSDVDLMVVGELDVFELGATVERLQSDSGRIVDLNLHTVSEWEGLKYDRAIKAIMREERVLLMGSLI
jgi:predicted nucleotidyltransferase